MEKTDFFSYSVVIPTLNRANLLPRALDSVFSQTHEPLEVIVVDDGSTDGTDRLIQNNYPEVSYIAQKTSGVSAARNRGIGNSIGTWIALLDSDDEWLPEKMERQLKALSTSPELRVCHTDEIWIRNGRRVNPKNRHAKPDGWVFSHCLPLCCVSPSSVVIHKSVFQRIGLFDPELPACEDYDLWLRIFSQYPVLLVDEHLTRKHGGHDDQLSRRYWGMDRFRVRAIDKLLTKSELTTDQQEECKKMLAAKTRILINGYRKRQNADDADHLNSMRLKWGLPVC